MARSVFNGNSVNVSRDLVLMWNREAFEKENSKTDQSCLSARRTIGDHTVELVGHSGTEKRVIMND